MRGLEEFLRKVNIQFEKDVRLKDHTTIGIGGSAPYFIKPQDIESIQDLRRYLEDHEIDWKVIGSGSNLLVDDKELGFVIISLDCLKGIRAINEEGLIVDAGVKLSHLCNYCLNKSLSGVEFLMGIPGTIGGAVKQNAGAYGKEIKDIIGRAIILAEDNDIKSIDKGQLGFSYRKSKFEEKGIIIGAELKLKRADKEGIREMMEKYQQERCRRQPVNERSAGCIFRNPAGNYAGRLIEEVGLKGLRHGDAVVSEKHANFIINRGNATFKDVMKLIEGISEKVYRVFGICLEMEVEVWS